MFKSQFIKNADKIAVVDENATEYTYRELISNSHLLLDFLNERGLIFTFCNNSIGSLFGYTSFLNGDHVQLLLDASMDLVQAELLISIYRPNFLWVPNGSLDNFSKAHVVYSNWNYSLIKNNSDKLFLNNDLALLLTTSGSTGSPKLVRISYKNLISNAKSIAKYLNITERERPITSLPMNYSYGISVINSHLVNGAKILLTNYSVVQKEFWDFAKNQKATSIAGVPYTYQMLKAIRFCNMELPYLKTLTQAGGKLPSYIVREFSDYAEKFNKRFFVMYGQTEATARISYLPFNMCKEKPESIGIPIPGGEFSIIDLITKKTITEANIPGELVYKGPNVSLGYSLDVLDLADGDLNLGKLNTGDIAYMDEDGFYFITGRLKRFIKIFGNRVNLDEVEQILLARDIECACIGVDDKLIVYTTLENKSDEILNLLTSKLKFNIRAFEIRIISQIPKNSSGKILYSQLLEK
jgi:acyl-CoA synthetase (AMP-forming)/AMP-acid ligase II